MRMQHPCYSIIHPNRINLSRVDGKTSNFSKKSRTDCQKSSLRTKAFIHLLPPLTKFLLSKLQKNLQGFSASGFRVWALHTHLKTTTEVILEQFELCTSAKNKWTKNIGSSRSVLTHVLNWLNRPVTSLLIIFSTWSFHHIYSFQITSVKHNE